MKHKILIVEDDSIMRVTLKDFLETGGYTVCACENGHDGINAFKKEDFSLVVTDVRLPDMLGTDVLKEVKEIEQNATVIVITAFGKIKTAVDTMKLGAFDYITKPFSLEEFKLIVERALGVKALKEENLRLKEDLSEHYCCPEIIGKSTEMRKVFGLISKISQTDSTLLILGENGTGKELVATSIHNQSSRKDAPLLKVNCAAIPETLFESELFGYEKGAFTGATGRKPGRFERAGKGTIFLDEIGDLPASVQVKLLRVLQDGTFERLGGTNTYVMEARVIAATNRNLQEDVKNGRFREDLFYRLNVIPLRVPPLRERREDIPLLVDHFLACYNTRFGKDIKFSGEAIRALMEYDFPGNIRELENIVERCIALANNGTTISADDLHSYLSKSLNATVAAITLSEAAAEAEKDHIRKILRATNGNKTKAAEILGISRKTLWERIKSYKIEG